MSAREAYLRASNYYRAAEFLLMDPEDPRIQITWRNSKECFRKAAKLFSPQVKVEPVEYHTNKLNYQNISTAVIMPRPLNWLDGVII
ncbi:MAG TPA: hypothetical protein VJ729_11720 [Nitrososphaeraceae archaeon]|nr:hypothetical protein [Nitrososphaeraceae archaeon]